MTAPQGYGLTAESIKRIGKAVKRSEEEPRFSMGYESAPGAIVARGSILVQITSTTQTAGRYPGTVFLRNGNAGTFDQPGTAGGVWVFAPNGVALTVGPYYRAFASGALASDGKMEMTVVEPSGAPTFDGARQTNSSTQTVAANTGAALSFDTLVYDTNGYISASEFVLSAGKWDIGLFCTWITSSTNVGSVLALIKDVTAGKTICGQQTPSMSGANSGSLNCSVQYPGGTTVQAQAQVSNFTDQTLTIGSMLNCAFWAHRLGS